MVSITLDTPIRLAVQCDIINKPETITGNDGKKRYTPYITGKHAYGWQTTDLTIGELRKHITVSGFASCTAALKTDHRHGDNFVSAWGILLDFDKNSLVETQQNDFVRSISTFGFTTPSNLRKTDKNPTASPRCKIACVFDSPVTDAGLFNLYVRAIMKRIAGIEVDASGKDTVRIAYGSQGGQWAFYGNGLSVDWLNELVAQDAIDAQKKSAKPKLKILRTHRNTQGKDDTLLSELSRQIADKLGVTDYTNNQSNLVSCPCGNHKNGDSNPSAVWNRDTKTLFCYTNSETYSAIETAKLLGIELDNRTARRGLWNSTRSYLLNYSYKNDKGRTVKPLTSLCRFLDAMIMYGVQPGWYTIKELDTALNGLFSDRTLRYTIVQSLLSSSDYYRMNAGNTGVSGLICICVPLLDYLSLSSKVDKNANFLTVPEPTIPDTGNKPAEYYFVPTEQELQKALGIERGNKHDYLNIEDLQSNGTYTKAIVRVAVENRPGQKKDTLSKSVGRTSRTVNRIVKDTPTLRAKRNEKPLVVTDDTPFPIEPDYSKYLMAMDTRTGEYKPRPYCLSSYLYVRKFTDKIVAFQHMATTYYSTKANSLSIDFSDDSDTLEDKSA